MKKALKYIGVLACVSAVIAFLVKGYIDYKNEFNFIDDNDEDEDMFDDDDMFDDEDDF